MKRIRTAAASALRALSRRSFVTTAVELVGIGVFSDGFWMAWHPLGPIVGGAALVAIGVIQAPAPKPTVGGDA